MNTDNKVLALFLASIAWADEDYSETEKNMVREIEQTWNMPGLSEEMDFYINQFKHFTGTELTSSLSDIIPMVHADDKDKLLAACIQLMGCDDYLADEEISNYFVIARMLGVGEEQALRLLSGLTTEDEVVVDD